MNGMNWSILHGDSLQVLKLYCIIKKGYFVRLPYLQVKSQRQY